MEKNQLKCGMWVEVKNGEKFLVLTDCNTTLYGIQEFCLVNDKGFCPSCNYNYNLENINDEYTIDKVYEGDISSIKYDREHFNLIWDRNNEVKPKDGDILVLKNTRNCVFVYKSDGGYKTSYYIGICLGAIMLDGIGNKMAMAGNNAVDFATEKEKQRLFNKLKKVNKKWNTETKQLESIKFIPKNGDICYFRNNNYSRIIIFKNYNGMNINCYAICNDKDDRFYWFDSYLEERYNGRIERMATDEEKQSMLKILEKNGKFWNPKKNQMEELIKVGDICILWNDNKKNAIISPLSYVDQSNKMYKTEEGLIYPRAIKFKSFEQYKRFINKD